MVRHDLAKNAREKGACGKSEIELNSFPCNYLTCEESCEELREKLSGEYRITFFAFSLLSSPFSLTYHSHTNTHKTPINTGVPRKKEGLISHARTSLKKDTYNTNRINKPTCTFSQWWAWDLCTIRETGGRTGTRPGGFAPRTPQDLTHYGHGREGTQRPSPGRRRCSLGLEIARNRPYSERAGPEDRALRGRNPSAEASAVVTRSRFSFHFRGRVPVLWGHHGGNALNPRGSGGTESPGWLPPFVNFPKNTKVRKEKEP